jgi:hypothetical protein
MEHILSAEEARKMSSKNRENIENSKNQHIYDDYKDTIDKITENIKIGIEKAVANGEYGFSGTLELIFKDYEKFENYGEIIICVLKKIEKCGYNAEFVPFYETTFFSSKPGFVINWL